VESSDQRYSVIISLTASTVRNHLPFVISTEAQRSYGTCQEFSPWVPKTRPGLPAP